MHYCEFAPSPALAPVVKCYWTLRGDSRGAPAERILPDGSFELVFHLGRPFVRGGILQPPAMLVGEIRRPVIVQGSGMADVFGVRFRLGGVAAFVHMPAREFRDFVLSIDEIFPQSLTERIASATSTTVRIHLLETFLIERMKMPRHDATLRAAIAIMRRRNTSRGVAAAVGVTERTLQRAFNECIGIGAKTLSRLFRFHAALADPLLDAGYYDDSHLIHDFHEFAGTTPSEFRRERNAINDAFVGNLQYDSGEHP